MNDRQRKLAAYFNDLPEPMPPPAAHRYAAGEPGPPPAPPAPTASSVRERLELFQAVRQAVVDQWSNDAGGGGFVETEAP